MRISSIEKKAAKENADLIPMGISTFELQTSAVERNNPKHLSQ